MAGVDQELAQWRGLLMDRKGELKSLMDISSGDRATVELDQQSVGRLSRMDAMQRQAMADAQQRARETELVRIDQALRRIEEGEFGYCVQCGEEIAEARLKIDPAASHCVACAK